VALTTTFEALTLTERVESVTATTKDTDGSNTRADARCLNVVTFSFIQVVWTHFVEHFHEGVSVGFSLGLALEGPSNARSLPEAHTIQSFPSFENSVNGVRNIAQSREHTHFFLEGS